MNPLKFVPLVLKQVYRHQTRSILTGLGVAIAMFLFCVVESMRTGVARATEVAEGDTVLIVYRENRFCPYSSRLPQYYQSRIESIPGVETAVPVRILVSSCRASLDVVTFRGVPEEAFEESYFPRFEIVAGSKEAWLGRSDAALIGESLAARRGIGPGDRFTAAGISVTVAAIFRSDEPQDQNAAYTHLSFVQQTAKRGDSGGIVTQFNVRVTDSSRLEEVARAIDAEFAHDPDPTWTSPEKAFVARAAAELVEIVHFASFVGWGALVAVFALIANAIVLAVQSRLREHAILQTLGFDGRQLAGLILAEGLVIGLVGGVTGLGAALALLAWQRFSLTVEGLNIEVIASPSVFLLGLTITIGLAALAGLVPAWQASRREIAASFRSV